MKEKRKRYSHPLSRASDHQAPHRHLTHLSLFCPRLLLLCSSLKKRSPKHCLRCSPPAAGASATWVATASTLEPAPATTHGGNGTLGSSRWSHKACQALPLHSHLTPSPKLHELYENMRKSRILVVHKLHDPKYSPF